MEGRTQVFRRHCSKAALRVGDGGSWLGFARRAVAAVARYSGWTCADCGTRQL